MFKRMKGMLNIRMEYRPNIKAETDKAKCILDLSLMKNP